MRPAFKVYGLIVLIILTAVSMYGFLLPYMVSAKHDELVLGGILLSLITVVPLAYMVYAVIVEAKKQLKLKRGRKS